MSGRRNNGSPWHRTPRFHLRVRGVCLPDSSTGVGSLNDRMLSMTFAEVSQFINIYHTSCLTRMRHIQYLQGDDLTLQRTGYIQ